MQRFIRAKNMQEGMVILWDGRECYIEEVVEDNYNDETVYEIVRVEANGDKWVSVLSPNSKYELISGGNIFLTEDF